MTDKELIRRALMGSREAQKECTEKRIALPCPFCGNDKNIISTWGMFRCWCPNCLAKAEDTITQYDALKSWNTRPAPPVGKCKDCKFYTVLGHCKVHSQEPDQYGSGAYMEMLPDDFCSYFDPREE